MIRSRLSNAQDQKGIFNTIKYVNRENDCVLLDTNIPILHIEKNDVNSYLSKYLFDFKDKFQTKIKNITQHDTVSYSKDDDITPAQALQYAKELYLKTHNIENRNYVMAVHNDTDNLHVHIVWSNLDKSGKSYKVSNDYRIIEKELDKIENKYKLKKPENRKATFEKPTPTNYKKSKNERKLEERGIKTIKEEIREKINLAHSLNENRWAFDFLEVLTQQDIKIIPNGKNGAYSIKYKNEIFKASEFGISKAKLESKYGKDQYFLTKFRKYLNQNEDQLEECSLTGGPYYNKKDKINKNLVLNTKFKYIENSEKISFSFKSSEKTAFEYYKNENRLSFNNTSRTSAKAGLQKWISMNEPGPMIVTGSEEFKKNLWLEFKLMKLDEKGYSLSGYEPKKEDLELLEKIKADYNKLKDNKKQEITEKVNPEQPKQVERVIIKYNDFLKEEQEKEYRKIIPENKKEDFEETFEEPSKPIRRNKFKI
ncbi:hypothetical protein EFK68_33580 [Pseudomonas aeruginosa]|nr:hypothetical protein EFK68_33580 [Pseudomonas aeruginosa]